MLLAALLAGSMLGAGDAVPAQAVEGATPELDATISLGEYPRSIVASADGDLMYVAVDNAFAVVVIDTETNQSIGQIPLGSMRPGLLIGSPDRSRLFALGGAEVAIIDPANQTANRVALPGDGETMQLSPDGSRLYVTTVNASTTITTINTASGAIENTAVLTATGRALAVSPDGETLYYAQSDGLYAMATSLFQRYWLSSPANVYQAALSADGTRLYAVDGMNTTSVVDTQSGSVVDTIPSPVQAVSIALSVDGTELYRINTEMSFGMGPPTQTSSLSIIDTASGDVTATAPLPWSSWRIFVDPQDGMAWVTGAEGVAVVDPSTATTESVNTLFAIVGLAFVPDSERAFAISDGGGAAFALSLASPAPVVTVPGAPGSVSAVPGARQAFVSWSAPSSDGGAPVSSYTVASSPGGAGCTATGLFCIVTGLTAGTSYTFSVTATNSVGASTPATSSTITVAASVAPSTPPSSTPGTSVRLVAADGSAVTALAPGQQFFAEVTGFAPSSTVEATLYSTPVTVGSALTDGTGAARIAVTIPANLAAGAHTLVVSGFGTSGQTAFAAVGVTAPGAATVTPTRRTLANSGSVADGTMPAVAGVFLVMGGAMLVMRRRARSRTR